MKFTNFLLPSVTGVPRALRTTIAGLTMVLASGVLQAADTTDRYFILPDSQPLNSNYAHSVNLKTTIWTSTWDAALAKNDTTKSRVFIHASTGGMHDWNYYYTFGIKDRITKTVTRNGQAASPTSSTREVNFQRWLFTTPNKTADETLAIAFDLAAGLRTEKVTSGTTVTTWVHQANAWRTSPGYPEMFQLRVDSDSAIWVGSVLGSEMGRITDTNHFVIGARNIPNDYSIFEPVIQHKRYDQTTKQWTTKIIGMTLIMGAPTPPAGFATAKALATAG